MPRKIVFLEMNEVPWRILDEYCRWEPDSFLAQLLPRCAQFTTITDDSGPLSPWITWPTLHRGVPNTVHGIKYFGEDLTTADATAPPIWQLLSRGGIRTGVGGPLQSYPMPEDVEKYAFYLPDTFASGDECHPEALSIFQSFNLAMARQSVRNVSTAVDWKRALRFLLHAPSLGLRISTCRAVLEQLAMERSNPQLRVRRRTFQPVLAFDLFLKQLEKTQPDFSNFFTNHVASAMHRYWAATFPDEYERFEMGPEWVERWSGEIRFSMDWADRFVRDLVSFVDRHPEYVLVSASSMGQSALRADRIETQLCIADLTRFMAAAGLESNDWDEKPAMAPKVSVYVDEGRRTAFADHLSALEIYGNAVNFEQKESGFFNVGIGLANVHDRPQFAKLRGEDVPFEAIGLGYRKVEDEAGSTAYHIPEGSLFIYDPLREWMSDSRPEIRTTELAPTLLAHFGVEIPSYMQAPRTLGPVGLDSRTDSGN